METRQAGVLLHITSLPSSVKEQARAEKSRLGQIDQQAWHFVDWMHGADLAIWQLLPLTHTHSDGSPYHALSAFALDPKFLPETISNDAIDADAFAVFQQTHQAWLDDYALFMVLRDEFAQQAWYDWPESLKKRDVQSLAAFAKSHAEQLLRVKQQQFLLFTQWLKLKTYANQKKVRLFGDMPLFVALDSADVWANQDLFKLDEQANPEVVAGVPPDYFSETGQRWGNPHYDWQRMEQDGFAWWHLRVRHSLSLFDWLRIDHFRGLESCWEIDADEPTAINGRWVPTPGNELLQSLLRDFDELPLIAEDLGVITDEVLALKDKFGLPGMAVMQFGFDGLPDNPHALHAQTANTVVYSGTHDNDTTLGWWQGLDDNTQTWIASQLKPLVGPVIEQTDLDNSMPWWLVVAVMLSKANKAIIPMQDFLMLDSTHRMNTPGTVDHNWQWQFDWSQVPESLAENIAILVEACQRSGFEYKENQDG
ncbi:4-alpha-glucanotransferase [Thiomicrorhabdus sediminis]|uniref:4-alpha-glucanotransferase n=1 Tax=Thiomicrorhabdus sediminis TaxID=2580412 RepID=A0A4P9K5K9_9GAMM|nr:4-alpha-glucanotransferase [Thiomicrorhabdus sediminis]QCU89537.1 4-alpha-glucanotransferase [Thiomicrorhabdus sediminis]